jgi:hypothetical protein
LETDLSISDAALRLLTKLIAKDYFEKTGDISDATFNVFEERYGVSHFRFNSKRIIEFYVSDITVREYTDEEEINAFIDSTGLREYLRMNGFVFGDEYTKNVRVDNEE